MYRDVNEYESQMAEVIDKARKRFVCTLSERLDMLDFLTCELEQGRGSYDVLGKIKSEAHKIRGIAKIVGFDDLGRTAADVEAEIEALTPLTKPLENCTKILGLIDMFLNCIDQAQQGTHCDLRH